MITDGTSVRLDGYRSFGSISSNFTTSTFRETQFLLVGERNWGVNLQVDDGPGLVTLQGSRVTMLGDESYGLSVDSLGVGDAKIVLQEGSSVLSEGASAFGADAQEDGIYEIDESLIAVGIKLATNGNPIGANGLVAATESDWVASDRADRNVGMRLGFHSQAFVEQ